MSQAVVSEALVSLVRQPQELTALAAHVSAAMVVLLETVPWDRAGADILVRHAYDDGPWERFVFHADEPDVENQPAAPTRG